MSQESSKSLIQIKTKAYKIEATHHYKTCYDIKAIKQCLEIQDRIHFFINCVVVKETFESLLKILERFLRKQVTEMEILHLSFGTANKKITKMGVWLVGKFLYKMYFYNMFKVKPILESIMLEISFYETHFDGYARGEEFKSLKTILNDEIRVCN